MYRASGTIPHQAPGRGTMADLSLARALPIDPTVPFAATDVYARQRTAGPFSSTMLPCGS